MSGLTFEWSEHKTSLCWPHPPWPQPPFSAGPSTRADSTCCWEASQHGYFTLMCVCVCVCVCVGGWVGWVCVVDLQEEAWRIVWPRCPWREGRECWAKIPFAPHLLVPFTFNPFSSSPISFPSICLLITSCVHAITGWHIPCIPHVWGLRKNEWKYHPLDGNLVNKQAI